MDSLKRVEHWDGGGKSMYEDWAKWKGEERPWPSSLASGYDHAPFAFYAGDAALSNSSTVVRGLFSTRTVYTGCSINSFFKAFTTRKISRDPTLYF